MSNGTGFGDDGQVIIKTNVSGTITNLVISISGEVNQNAFTTVSLSGNTSGDTAIVADAKTDTLILDAGSNVTLAGTAGTDTVTVSGADNYADSLAFATGTGVLTVERTGALADLTQDLDGRYIQADGTLALTNNWDAGSFYIQAETLRSDVADGTPPLVVTSTTKVDNLNVDRLDGNHASAFQPYDSDLVAIAILDKTDGNFIVANGSAWVVESGATARTSLGVDAAGTDNSTNVTLAGSLDYLTLSGQEITRNAIDLTADVTGNLPDGNIASSGTWNAKQNALTFGIAHTNALKVDHSTTAADNDYAKFTASGIEGRSYAEVKTDLSLGTAADRDAEDTLTNGANLPDGAAIIAYGNANWGGSGLDNVVEDTTPQLGGNLDANGNHIDMGDNLITDTKVGQWDTAYGWGNHGDAGYQAALTFGIAHNNALKVDHSTTAADNDYAKFTSNGIEGRSYAEVKTDLGIGTLLANADTLSSGRYDDD
jgi:hypothetical protein